MNKASLVVSTSLLLVFFIATSTTTSFAFGQNNATSGIEEKMKASMGTNSVKATATGDVECVFICPANLRYANQCQIYVGQPAYGNNTL